MKFVQTIGRGLRMAPGKERCIILDHAGNTRRLGLVTEIDFSALDDGKPGSNSDKDKAASDPVINLCKNCRCVLPPCARSCDACGTVIPAVTPIIEGAGELVAFGEEEPTKARTMEALLMEQRDFFAQLKAFAASKGYAKGWAAHKFHKKYGNWPNEPSIRDAPPAPCGVKIRNWIWADQIAFSRARGRG